MRWLSAFNFNEMVLITHKKAYILDCSWFLFCKNESVHLRTHDRSETF